MLVAAAAVRLRRREIALLRHLGASRPAIAGTHAVEALTWSLVGATLVLAATVVVATRDTTADQAAYLLRLAAAGTGAAVLAAGLTASATAALVRAGSVLRYLNDA